MAESGIDKMRRNIKLLKEQQIRVGWLEGNVYPDGTPVAQVAFFNEYGGIRRIKQGSNSTQSNIAVIPPRAPLRITLDTKGKLISEQAAPFIAKGLQNDKVLQSLELVGLMAASHVRDTIGSGLPPPNAESTVDGMLLRKKVTDDAGNVSYEEVRAGSAQKESRTFGQGKGFNKPLVDTANMMNSVQHLVEKA